MPEAKLHMSSVYGQSCCVSSRSFYEGRIRFILENHSFQQREQLLGCVLSAAMGDRGLSASDLLSVINQVELAHQKSMEENYNEDIAW